MARKVFDLFTLMPVFLCSLIGTGFAFHIEITPNEVNGLVQNEVNIFCEVDRLDSRIQEIMILELSKNDVPIVILRQNSQVSIGKGLVARFKADGSIAKSLNTSYIHVTVANPTAEDSGSYTCLLYFLDELNQLQEERKSTGLTVSNMDLKAAVLFLVDKVSNLETELTLQKRNSSDQLQEQKKDFSAALEKQKKDSSAALEKQKKDSSAALEKQKNDLSAALVTQKTETVYRENQLQEQILALTSQVDIKSNKLDQYTNTSDDQIVYFQATHTTSGAFQGGRDFIYSHVLENVGDAYDGNTGVFTAPVKGYYQFAVSVTVKDKWIYIDLKSNDGRVVSRLLAGGLKSNADYIQSSSVTKLNAGQTVRPVIERVLSGLTMWSEENNGPLNTFSGFLLKKL